MSILTMVYFSTHQQTTSYKLYFSNRRVES